MERFTISLDDRLAKQFDEWLANKSYANRSEAVRDLLRSEIARTQLHTPGHASTQCVASLSYVFNHHERDLAERLTAIQHEQHDLSVATMHAHLDHDHCLETVILRGHTSRVSRLADEICAERGVHHGKMNIISVEVHEPHATQPGRKRRASKAKTHLHVKPTA